MYYINQTPTANGNYGNPTSNRTEGTAALPEALLADYLAAKGFVTLTVEEREFTRTEERVVENEETGEITKENVEIPYTETVVTGLEVNETALEAYEAGHPDTPESATPTQLDRVEAQAMYTALMTDTLLEE